MSSIGFFLSEIGLASTALPSASRLTPSSFKPKFSTSKVPFKMPIIIPPIFFPGGRLGTGFKGRKFIGKKTRGRLPSFGAIYFRIRGKEATPGFKGKFSGLELRPVSSKYSFVFPKAKTKAKKKSKKKKKK